PMGRMSHAACLRRLLVGIVVLLGIGAASGPPASAATFTVNATSDVPDANLLDGVCQTLAGACTLRAAIQQANALPRPDTIGVPSGTYTLTLGGGSEDAAAAGDLDLTGSVDISAPNGATVDAAGLDRVFHVTAPGAIVTIDGLTITGGAPPAGQDGGGV